MLSMDFELSVPGFKKEEIGGGTLVRAYKANLQIQLTNDGQTYLRELKVKPVIESYLGQDKPMLLFSLEEKMIKEILPKSMVPLTFSIWPNFPGLISFAVHITNIDGSDVMAKRQSETTYQEQPVRWWFHVVDDISIEILKTLKALVAKERKKTKTES